MEAVGWGRGGGGLLTFITQALRDRVEALSVAPLCVCWGGGSYVFRGGGM